MSSASPIHVLGYQDEVSPPLISGVLISYWISYLISNWVSGEKKSSSDPLSFCMVEILPPRPISSYQRGITELEMRKK